MGKVVMKASVSVDGFIAAENDDPGPLFDGWSRRARVRKRYFGSVESRHLLEDPDVVIQGNRVLRPRYRVRRSVEVSISRRGS
ncbi:MAG: hypothetical protein WAK00_06995 [Microbacterium sp.]